MRLAAKFAAGLVIAGVALWLAGRELLAAVDPGVALDAILAAARAVPRRVYIAYAAIFAVVHGLRVWRWVLQVEPLGEPDRRLITRVCLVGYAAIVVFPFRLGELVRPFLLSARSARIGFTAALGTAVVERVVDGLVITGLLFVAVATAPREGNSVIQAAGQISALVFLAAGSGLLIFAARRAVADRLLRATFGTADAVIAQITGRSPSLVTRVTGLLSGFLQGVRSLGSTRALARFLAVTVAYWGTNALGIWILARGFGLDVPLSGAVGVLAVLVVGLMVPSGSGFVGTFQLFLAHGLALYVDAPKEGSSILSCALAMNGIQLVIQIGAAAPFMQGVGIRWRDLGAVQREASERARA